MIETKLLLRNAKSSYEYALYGIGVGSCRGYILYAENGQGAAMELICTSEERVRALFSDICHCELSPAHLCDVVSDFRMCETRMCNEV